MKLRSALIVLSGLAVCMSACSAKKTKSPDEYNREASDHFRKGAYLAAAERYRELLDQHPFSEFSEEAEFRIAHAHFLNDTCPEAVAAFTDFQRRHPTSPHLPMVGFLIAQCYERQMQPSDRDQTSAQNAHAYYIAVDQQYPNSPYADLSRDRLLHCRENLARHEMLVAKFYLQRKNRKAAETRFLDLINEFNDTYVAGNALYDLGKLYAEIGSEDRAALAFAAVGYHHPDNGDAKRAMRELEKLPEEEPLPSGDPLVTLAAESGRQRRLSLANIADVQERGAAGAGPAGAPPPRPGFGFPSGGGGAQGNGPFGGQY